MLAAALPGAAAGTDVPELRSRAERFWAAEVRKDFDTVYTMLSPGERDLRAQGDYVATRRDLGPFHYLSAKVGDIDSAGDVGWVRVTVVYTTPKFPQARIDGEFWQVWRNQDGWFPVAVKDRERYPELPPYLRPAADEAALKERATGLWKAKAEQDWPTVYRYMPPYWRERVPLETFLKGKAGLVVPVPAQRSRRQQDAAADGQPRRAMGQDRWNLVSRHVGAGATACRGDEPAMTRR